MENGSCRNNLVLHGLSEEADEVSEALLSNVSQFSSAKLKIICPQIERSHRHGSRHDDRSRTIIIKIPDFRAKI